jgi:hypothetical protein
MKAMAIRTMRITPAVSGTERNMPSGISGSLTRVSQRAKTTKSTRAPTMKPQVFMSPQPQAGALMRAQTRQNMAPDNRTMPGMSKDRGAFSARWSIRMNRPKTSAITPTGTLMKKTDCQLTCSTSTPPRIGPPAVEAPITMPHMPMAMLSFSAGKVARSRPSAAGIRSAPNRPWSTRKTTTAEMVLESPIAPEAAAKPTTPMRNVCRWPNRSPSLPAVISETARARK